MSKFVAFLNDESGASAAEYALILALVTAAIVTVMGVLSTNIQGAITAAATAIGAPAA